MICQKNYVQVDPIVLVQNSWIEEIFLGWSVNIVSFNEIMWTQQSSITWFPFWRIKYVTIWTHFFCQNKMHPQDFNKRTSYIQKRFSMVWLVWYPNMAKNVFLIRIRKFIRLVSISAFYKQNLFIKKIVINTWRSQWSIPRNF